MKESNALRALERSETGKGAARKVRAAGACPAVLYGPGAEPRTLQVDPRDLQKLLQGAGESSLIDLEVGGEGGESFKVIIRDLQFPPIGDVPAHIDFYRVSLDRTLNIAIPVVLTGSCEAVEQKAATLSQNTHEITVECLPTDIPSSIEVDISTLELGSAIHAKDLSVPEGVSISDRPDLPIVTITAMKEEIVEEEEAAAEPGAEEPEVIGQDKAEAGEASES